ncbi:MAG TPA: pectate lyase [Verrucomicrobiales bacterium]|nr:pectate lyase [Verrucomicrobiales bacterium]
MRHLPHFHAPLGAVLLAAISVMSAASAADAGSAWETPPGWTETRGGEGGKVLRVTTLAASGAGSFAEALLAKGPRIIEFDVAGVIDLGGRSLKISNPQVTISGETAPSPGITLIHGGLSVSTDDVIIRHLRIRPGAGKRAKKSGWEVDSLATNSAHDVIVDHCSVTWGTDENLSASGPRFEGATPDEWRKNTSRRITFSHCIIGEGLHDSTHSKGPHSKGSLIHDNTSDIAILGNLYISNDDRNPLFKGGARGVVVNNVIQNPGSRVMQCSLVESEWKGKEWQRGQMAVIGNVARQGPSTRASVPFISSKGPWDLHLHDNTYTYASGEELSVKASGTNKELRIVSEPPLWPARLKARPASETAEWVLATAGARPWDRDETDRRLIEEARTGAGKIIHHESEAGASGASRR